MIHPIRLAVLGAFLLGAGPAVLADDVVHFTNGTFMKVQSYTVDGDMIKVVLGPDASMAFPRNLVESIERAGRTIYPQTSGGPANVVTSGGVGGQVSGTGPYVQTGEHQIPSRYRRNAAREAGDATDTAEADGQEASRPGPGEFQLPGRRGVLKTTGRREMPAGEGLVQRDSPTPPSTARPRVFTTMAPRGVASAPPEPPPAPTETPDEGTPESPEIPEGTETPEGDGTTPPE